jgi:hypothetical protein
MAERGYITTKRRKKEKKWKNLIAFWRRQVFWSKTIWSKTIWPTHYLADSLFGRLIIWSTNLVTMTSSLWQRYIFYCVGQLSVGKMFFGQKPCSQYGKMETNIFSQIYSRNCGGRV